jgi:branched-chain amino acid transport system permease protein
MNGVVQRPTLPFGWDLGIHPDRPGNELHFYWFCLGVMVLVMWAVRNLRHTRWGRSFLAVRDNERAAAAYGVAPTQAKLLAFAVSGMIAGLAGYLFLFSQQQVDAASFPVTTSLVLFSAVVIGGLGSMSGAVIGALFFEGIQYFVKVDALQQLTTGIGLIVVLAFLPGGLGSLFFSTRDAALRLLARRLRIVVPSLVADRRVEMETTLTGTPLSRTASSAGVEVAP